jgi:hypothetical protein
MLEDRTPRTDAVPTSSMAAGQVQRDKVDPRSGRPRCGATSMKSLMLAVVIFLLWISPVLVLVILVRVARRFGVDLRRQPPPDDVDYRKW